MNRRIPLVVTAFASCFSLLFLVGCAASSDQEGGGASEDAGFEQIDAEAAKKLMDEESDYVIWTSVLRMNTTRAASLMPSYYHMMK